MNSPNVNRATILALAAIALALRGGAAQSEALVDPAFFGDVSGGTVFALAAQKDGRLIIAGDFTHVSGRSRPRMARLNADGSLDDSFHPPFGEEGTLTAVLITSGGTIYASGVFRGLDRYENIVRLLPDGRIDRAFAIEAPPNGWVDCLGSSMDGGIILGGRFNQVDGTPAWYLGRLNSEGRLDATFRAGLEPSPVIEAGIEAIAVEADSRILIGGIFESARGPERLARFNRDGSLDESFTRSHGSILYTKAILPLAEGKLLAAGMKNSEGEALLRRLRCDGSVDASFQPPTFKGLVETIQVDSSGGVFAGGSFREIGDQTRENLVRFLANGSVDPNWTIHPNGPVTALLLEGENALFAAGGFTSIGGANLRGIARIILKRTWSSAAANEPFRMLVPAPAGSNWVIEESPDLLNWSPFAIHRATTNGLEITDPTAASRSRRFFRATARP